MDLSLLLTLAVIHSVALISPGPDFAIIVKMASQQSRPVALAAALGISIAILIHSILSLTGVSLLIRSSETLYVVIQVVGASYLGWMGLGALSSGLKAMAIIREHKRANRKQTPHSDQPLSGVSNSENHPSSMDRNALEQTSNELKLTERQGFMKGLYTNLLNPKALVFFLTLFSALITPDVNSATKVAAALVLLGLSFLWFGFLALMLTKAGIKQTLQQITPIVDAIIGVIFMSVAIAIVYGLILG